MDRERLTITLKKSLLNKVDGIIDGVRIRNRSHAIEYLITKSISPTISQAIILAGGKGLNMRPFTYEMPKGLFPVGGRPILEHIVELLSRYQIRDLIFSIGHLGEKIKEHFGDGKKFGVKITYISESREMGTGGAIARTRALITSDTFLVIHGDTLIDIDISDMVTFHREQETPVTIALTSVVDPSAFGEVVMRGSHILRFIEKPKKGKQRSQLINSGLYIMEKSIFNYLPSKEPSHLEDLFPQLATKGQLCGYLFEGRWVDIGTPVSYERAIKLWSEAEVKTSE